MYCAGYDISPASFACRAVRIGAARSFFPRAWHPSFSRRCFFCRVVACIAGFSQGFAAWRASGGPGHRSRFLHQSRAASRRQPACTSRACPLVRGRAHRSGRAPCARWGALGLASPAAVLQGGYVSVGRYHGAASPLRVQKTVPISLSGVGRYVVWSSDKPVILQLFFRYIRAFFPVYSRC